MLVVAAHLHGPAICVASSRFMGGHLKLIDQSLRNLERARRTRSIFTIGMPVRETSGRVGGSEKVYLKTWLTLSTRAPVAAHHRRMVGASHGMGMWTGRSKWSRGRATTERQLQRPLLVLLRRIRPVLLHACRLLQPRRGCRRLWQLGATDAVCRILHVAGQDNTPDIPRRCEEYKAREMRKCCNIVYKKTALH